MRKVTLSIIASFLIIGCASTGGVVVGPDYGISPPFGPPQWVGRPDIPNWGTIKPKIEHEIALTPEIQINENKYK